MQVSIKDFTKDQVLSVIVWRNCDYTLKQGYTKENLKNYIDQAYDHQVKNNLRIDVTNGTVKNRELGIVSRFSDPASWEKLDHEDKDPLYELAHQVKCDAVALYNKTRFK